MNSTELRAAFSLAAIYMSRMLGLFMVMPVLAVLAVNYTDFSPWLLGLAIGGYGLTQAALQIPFGMLSDKIGRKPVIIGGLFLFALGSLIAGFADSMFELVIGRILQGAGAIAGAVMALAADVSREEQRAKVMAIIGISIGFSFYLALLLGPALASSLGLSGIFFITAVLAMLGIGLVGILVPNAVNVAPSGDTIPRQQQLKALLRNRELGILNISVCLLHMLITILFVNLPVLLQVQGIELNEQWPIYLPILLVSILGLVILMRLGRHNTKRTMRQSVLFMLFAFALLIAFSQFSEAELWQLYLIGILFFIGFNYLEANLPALVSSLAPAGAKGSAMGIYASFQFSGAFLGGIVSGAVASLSSEVMLYILVIAVCIIWWLLLSRLPNQTRLKRVTLSIDTSLHSMAKVTEILRHLDGVKDINIVENEYAAYLKVDPSHFDLAKAQEALR